MTGYRSLCNGIEEQLPLSLRERPIGSGHVSVPFGAVGLGPSLSPVTTVGK